MPSSLNLIGAVRIELQQVDSTNNYATALAHAGMAQHGTTVLAHHQTRGKGQREKQWLAIAGTNLTLSVILLPENWPGCPPFLLSQAVAVGVFNFFHRYAGSETRIKWPNDLYWRDRKAGGILIENIFQGSTWKYAIAGIGININQVDFGELGDSAVSLRQVTGQQFLLEALEQELYVQLGSALDLMQENPSAIRDEYANRLYKRGERVRLKKDSRVFEAMIKGVSDGGELIVQHALEERFSVGEIEWLR